MKFKNIILFILIILCCFGIFKSFSHFTSINSVEDNNLNIGVFPKVRVRIYQVIMPLVHEYSEDEYEELFKTMAIEKIVPVINNPTTMDKISSNKELKFKLRKNIKFHANNNSKAQILHHVVVISNGNPFNDGRDKINFSKEKLECKLDNVYIGETSKDFYNVNFRRTNIHRNSIDLNEKEKYIITFNWNKEKQQYITNKKSEKSYYNADLVLFDITSFIIDDADTINELVEEMGSQGDEVISLHNSEISVSIKLTSDKFKVTKSQNLKLLRE